MHLRSRVRSAERGSAFVVIVLGPFVLGGGCIVPLPFAGDAAPSGLTEATGTDDALGPTDEAADVETSTGGRAESGSSTGSDAPESDGVRLDLGSGGTSTGSSGGAEPPSPPANDGDCCEAALGTGCGDPAISACVCAVDPVCCDLGWDALCVDHVELLGCGGCGVGPASLDVAGCCTPHPDPSCADEAIAACVCAGDPYCCDIAWDQVCVDAVTATGCGTCDAADAGDALPVADCCTPMNGPGCPDPELEACVCALDAFCCETLWDELCADEAVGYCGACGDAGTTEGTDGGGGTGGSSSGTTD
jgi:hypothetical protein